MIKKILILVAAITMICSINTTVAHAYKIDTETNNTIQSDDRVWKLQTINGRLHRRLWSERDKIWLSNWIPV